MKLRIAKWHMEIACGISKVSVDKYGKYGT